MHIRQPPSVSMLLLTLLSLGGCTLEDLEPGHIEALRSCAGPDPGISAESRELVS